MSSLNAFHSDGLAAVLANHEYLNADAVSNMSSEDLACISKHLEISLEDSAYLAAGFHDLILLNQYAPEPARLSQEQIIRLMAAVNRCITAPMLPLSGILSGVSGDLSFREGYGQALQDNSIEAKGA